MEAAIKMFKALSDETRLRKWNIYSANQELKNNKIIQSLEDELKLFDQDLNNFKKYRKKIYEKN